MRIHISVSTYLSVYIWCVWYIWHTYMWTYFIVISQIPIQHHRVHSSLPLFLFVTSFSDSEKPGSQHQQCIYLFVQPYSIPKVVSELITHTPVRNKFTRSTVFVCILFIFRYLSDSSKSQKPFFSPRYLGWSCSSPLPSVWSGYTWLGSFVTTFLFRGTHTILVNFFFNLHTVKFTLSGLQFCGFWQIYRLIYPPSQPWNSCVTLQNSLTLPFCDQPLFLANTDLFSISMIFSFLGCHISGFMQCVALGIWLLSLSKIHSFYSRGRDPLLSLFILLLRFPSLGCCESFQAGSCDPWTCPHHVSSTSLLSGTTS